ncbi:MAG: tRNA (N(6)-L-threonylcarbamoyladenosine(37)-C(2))-methylthiotransferase MtaB [Eubacteriales bacterium]|nr:tRNA (N(6)-L-threonylcarbamoyladenosine(37)-C(2))-methylthiotransferase MtaB [Eubacteriales bacterium]
MSASPSKTVAFCTLGCKVNQYDSQAMLEKFLEAGFEQVDFDQAADVYVVNTCVVTAVGEQKSRQMLRRALRQNPQAQLVAAGCLAQKDADKLKGLGVRLVVGNQHRGRVVALLEEAVAQGQQTVAVEDVSKIPYEPLKISRQEGRSRANVKIQEGCDRFCAYCIIPYVRGTIRSREPGDIGLEARSLADAGYREMVLTGIHLSSYGRDLEGVTLLDAVWQVARVPGIDRIRLGSLEPVIAAAEFVKALAEIPQVCPQFHLSLQSGSDSVLKRMRRRYCAAEYLAAARRLQEAFPGCALTTDLMVGFPGETEEEFAQSLAFCREVGFARMHVFPYSTRAGTAADRMPGQLSREKKASRAREAIALSEALSESYRKALIGTRQPVLFETAREGEAIGHSPQFIEVIARGGQLGEIARVQITGLQGEGLVGTII